MRRSPFIALLALLAACSPHETERAVDAAATVNGKPIPIARFRRALAQLNPATAPPSAPVRLLDGMIDRELLAQEAERIELDARPSVVDAVEAARAAILAQAYVEHELGTAPADAHQVRSFYHDNPDLFAKRRIYRLFELAVIAPPATVEALRKRAARADLYELAQWLKARKVAFNTGGATKAAEQLAPGVLERLRTMRDGEVTVISVSGGASVIQLVQSENAPLTQDEAAPMIERLLRARRRREIATREVKYLRTRAAIEYAVELGGPGQARAESTTDGAPPAR